MFSAYRLKFSLLGLVMSVLGVVLFSALGTWQIYRALEKQALQDAINARQHQTPLQLHQGNNEINRELYRTVMAHGRFDPAHEILIDNEIHEGKAGYHVLTPLILDDQSAILVNRGWVAQGRSRDELPEYETPQGLITVTGKIAPPKSRPALVLKGNALNPGKVWLFLDLQIYENVTGLKLMPVVIQMDETDPHGFVRQWPSYDARVWMHIGYAIHWFVFAIAVVVIYFAVNIKKKAG